MTLLNIKENDPQKNILIYIIETLLSCSDGKYITEIFAKDGSFRQGFLGNWVGLMIELSPDFANNSLYKTINDLEDELANFDTIYIISLESNTMDRSSGTILFKK